MPPPVKKVIRAAAGTGKTYRLALEYIALLLKYSRYGLRFNEILVITFTKKATAEIRERIFLQLEELVRGTPAGLELQRNLERFFGIPFGEEERLLLERVRRDMLLNKAQVQISTIDSFTNAVFKTIVAPYLGIGDYLIEEEPDEEVQDELYRTVLEDPSKLEAFRSFFTRSGRREIQAYEAFFRSVLEKRWLFLLIEQSRPRREFEENVREKAEAALQTLRRVFSAMNLKMQQLALAKQKTSDGALLKDFKALLDNVRPNFRLEEVHDLARRLIDEEPPNKKLIDLLIGDKNLWDSRLAGKEKEDFLELRGQVRRAAADWVFYSQLLNEERELSEIVRCICERYDELKLRDAALTFADILYYTYRCLHDPELSLLDGDAVVNAFYERLSADIRFVLIDEFQDTSILQYRTLMPIIREVISGAGVKEYGGVIVVGDEKQAIYGWRGGERDLLLKMPQVLQDAEQLTLDTSFRSDEKLIEFVNRLFTSEKLQQALESRGIQWPYFPVKAHKANGAGLVTFFLRGYAKNGDIKTAEEALYDFFTEVLEPLRRDGLIDISRTAILARTNSELQAAADALGEMGIRYVYESSDTILNHRAVKPLYLLLRFLLTRDLYDLLRFLRSDAVLLNSRALKEILLRRRDAGKSADILDLIRTLPPLLAGKLAALVEESERLDPLTLAVRAAEQFNLLGTFNRNNDAENLYRFFMIIGAYLQDSRSGPKTLKGFLDYCELEGERDPFRSAAAGEEDAVSLMTIHKSKGLEFDHVFLFWNLSARRGNDGARLSDYVLFRDDYSGVENFVLTYNFSKELKESSFGGLVEAAEQRSLVEELNTLYVALTRAKSTLSLAFAYEKQGGFDKYLVEKDSLSPAAVLVDCMRNFFRGQPDYFEKNSCFEKGQFGAAARPVFQKPESRPGVPLDRALFAVDHRPFFEVGRAAASKAPFVDRNAVMVGNAAHYFLSFIRSGTEEELNTARRRTAAYYGTLIPQPLLAALTATLEGFVHSRPDIFKRSGRVFTEQTLFTPEGREIRIDRLMIDEENKVIEIIDYKTGRVPEPDQLDLYASAVEALPAVRQGGFQIKKQFVELNL